MLFSVLLKFLIETIGTLTSSDLSIKFFIVALYFFSFFDGTIEENVNINKKATQQQVIDACQKSGAIDFIRKQNSGFNQIIGQNGEKLSGGERQKLAVARAILKQSDILILDEITEGFDKKSREKLLDTLYNDFDEKTIIFVTHRQDELKYADCVFRIERGKIDLYNVSEEKNNP